MVAVSPFTTLWFSNEKEVVPGLLPVLLISHQYHFSFCLAKHLVPKYLVHPTKVFFIEFSTTNAAVIIHLKSFECARSIPIFI